MRTLAADAILALATPLSFNPTAMQPAVANKPIEEILEQLQETEKTIDTAGPLIVRLWEVLSEENPGASFEDLAKKVAEIAGVPRLFVLSTLLRPNASYRKREGRQIHGDKKERASISYHARKNGQAQPREGGGLGDRMLGLIEKEIADANNPKERVRALLPLVASGDGVANVELIHLARTAPGIPLDMFPDVLRVSPVAAISMIKTANEMNVARARDILLAAVDWVKHADPSLATHRTHFREIVLELAANGFFPPRLLANQSGIPAEIANEIWLATRDAMETSLGPQAQTGLLQRSMDDFTTLIDAGFVEVVRSNNESVKQKSKRSRTRKGSNDWTPEQLERKLGQLRLM